MIIRILFSYIIGYLGITIEGYYIERFINMCRNNKIAIWHLKRNKDVQLDFRTNIGNFKEICNIAKKTKCKLKIKSKRGIPFLLHRYKKRKIFFILLIVIIFLVLLSSHFVWNVDIIEENGQELENIVEDLEDAGLKVGELKSKIETKEIINKIRLKRSDIAWIGIELKGTNAVVKIVKANKKPDIVNEEEYCNIIADKAGIITKINAQTGTANVKVGDTINVGDILINGWMEGKYTGIRYVHAQGEIEAKVWYTKQISIPYDFTERTETGNIENQYTIKINNFKINLYKGVSKFKIYDTIETENKMKLFSDFYLPISIIKTTYREVNEQQKTYKVEEAKNLGIEQLQKELDNEIENTESIVGKNINTYEKEDSIDVYVTYEVLENIGTNEKIIF
jgi:similar to stage IV sporulation protein